MYDHIDFEKIVFLFQNLEDKVLQKTFGEDLDGHWSEQTKSFFAKYNIEKLNMSNAWCYTPQYWRCPVCNRSKSEIIRPSKKKKGLYLANIVKHHDHLGHTVSNLLDYKHSQNPYLCARFSNTCLCEDCNNAEGNMKEAVKNTYFSFSPEEIKKFILPKKNTNHSINKEIAFSIWNSLSERIEKRIEIALQFMKKSEAYYKSECEPLERYRYLMKLKFTVENDRLGFVNIDTVHKDSPDWWVHYALKTIVQKVEGVTINDIQTHTATMNRIRKAFTNRANPSML